MSTKSRKKELVLSRRQMLALAGSVSPLMLNPVQVLLKSLVDGMIMKAQASSSGLTPRNLFVYHLHGAPWRGTWDMPYSPYGSNVPDRSLWAGYNDTYTNKFSSGGANPVYAASPFTVGSVRINMPYLWNSNIATPSGHAPMANLLPNMLAMRGLNMIDLSAGHDDGSMQQTRPSAAAPSLTGSVADGSNQPIPAVATSYQSIAYSGFRGNKSSQTLITSTTNPIGQALSPFNRSADGDGTFLSLRNSGGVNSAISSALSQLSSYAASQNPGADALFGMRNSAEGLLLAGVNTAISQFATIKAKYTNLISQCAMAATNSSSPLAILGVTNAPVPLPSPTSYGIVETIVGGPQYIQNSDVRTIITSSSAPDNMATIFAIAELLIGQGFSSSVLGATEYISGLNWVNPAQWASGPISGIGSYWNFDEHFAGSYTSLIIDSFLYQCLASCIYEFSQAMKSAPGGNGLAAGNIWPETVVMIAGDFNRIPHGQTNDFHTPDLSGHTGGEHGLLNVVQTVFSGAIQEPMVLGNISHGQSGYPYYGDAGQGTNVTVDGANRILTIGDSTSTIAALCRVKAPISSTPSLVTEQSSGGITPNIPLATET